MRSQPDRPTTILVNPYYAAVLKRLARFGSKPLDPRRIKREMRKAALDLKSAQQDN